MARFCTLCSSSSGNSTYVGTADEGILIDAGTNCKQLCLALQSACLSPEKIKAVFVTHEHSDHVGALRVFASKYNIPVYATGGTLSALSNNGIINGKFATEKIMPDGVSVGKMHITPFATSHDSKESCGYVIELPERRVGICTDTGKVTDEMLRNLCDCDLVLLESNYDDDLLDFGPYTPALKARIRSEFGHMSNVLCAQTARQLLESGVRRFVLGHLSRENNTPERAFLCTDSVLKRTGAESGVDYMLQVAPVGSMDKFMIF